MAILFLGTLLLFSRGWRHEFVNYDDPDYVTANAHVKAGLSAANVAWAMRANVASNWHPLTWMSHMLDYSLFGGNASGHHATSIVLHGINAVLAFLAFRRLTGALWTSALCAAFFAWHPLRVESVAWVAERKDVLSGLFWFVVLWTYAIYAERRRTGAAGAMRFYAGALVAFALGLMAKPMLVTLPCVLLLLDVWPLGRTTRGAGRAEFQTGTEKKTPKPLAHLGLRWGPIALEKLPFFALSIASSWVTYGVQKESGAVRGALSLSARLDNAAVAVVRYLGKIFAPVDLAVLYPHPGVWPKRTVVACVVIIVALSGVAWMQRRRQPWVAVGWLWFLGTLVPVIGIVQVGLQSMADRYTYLPMLGIALALLWTLRDALTTPGAQRVGLVVATLALAACSAVTWKQLGYWQNSLTLFDHAIAVTEKNYVAWTSHGLAQLSAGRIDEAIADYRRSLAINPDYPEANNNFGTALDEQGRAKEAVPFLRAAVRLKPGPIETHINLGTALADAGEFDEAFAEFETVLAQQPDHANALNSYGVALAMRGRLPEAIAKIEAALRLQPDDAGAHFNLGNALAMSGQNDAAIAHYLRALELKPGAAQTHDNLANALVALGRFDEAAASFERTLSIQSVNPRAHANLGGVLLRLGRRDAAIAHLRTALQQRPDFAQAKAWLDAAMSPAPSAAPAATGK